MKPISLCEEVVNSNTTCIKLWHDWLIYKNTHAVKFYLQFHNTIAQYYKITFAFYFI